MLRSNCSCTWTDCNPLESNPYWMDKWKLPTSIVEVLEGEHRMGASIICKISMPKLSIIQHLFWIPFLNLINELQEASKLTIVCCFITFTNNTTCLFQKNNSYNLSYKQRLPAFLLGKYMWFHSINWFFTSTFLYKILITDNILAQKFFFFNILK